MMYDLSLMEDLKEFKRGSKSIYELRFRYNNIFRIIKNRTIEKLNVLELLLSNKSKWLFILIDFYVLSSNDFILSSSLDFKLYCSDSFNKL